MNWNVSILEELEQSDFGTVSNRHIGSSIHLNSCLTVVKNGLLDEALGMVRLDAVEESIGSVHNDVAVAAVELHNLHVVLGNGRCFSNENLLNTAHLLWGVEFANQDVLRVHSHDGEGKRNSDGQRETLWDGDYNKHNNQVDVAGKLLCQDARDVIGRGRNFQDESYYQRDEDNSSTVNSPDGELVREIFELLLQLGVDISVKLLDVLEAATANSDAANQGLGLTSLDVASHPEEWVLKSIFTDW